MSGSRLLIAVASVLAGTTVLFGVFGLVYNPILLLAAVPFAASTYLLWSHATGRLEGRMRERARYRRADVEGGSDVGGGPFGRRAGPGARGAARDSTAWRRPPPPGGGPTADVESAARVLGVDPDADDATIRRAFREKAKVLHPDAPGGDEAAFRRVRAAYEELTGSQ